MATLSDVPRCSPTVLFQEMDSGAVLFCSRTEIYFGLNPVGVTLWKALEQSPASFEALVDQLAHVYPEPPRADLESDAREFLAELEANELVLFPPASPSGAAEG